MSEEAHVKDFANEIATVRTALYYAKPLADIHADLMTRGWGAEEAHWLIRAAQVEPGV